MLVSISSNLITVVDNFSNLSASSLTSGELKLSGEVFLQTLSETGEIKS